MYCFQCFHIHEFLGRGWRLDGDDRCWDGNRIDDRRSDSRDGSPQLVLTNWFNCRFRSWDQVGGSFFVSPLSSARNDELEFRALFGRRLNRWEFCGNPSSGKATSRIFFRSIWFDCLKKDNSVLLEYQLTGAHYMNNQLPEGRGRNETFL